PQTSPYITPQASPSIPPQTPPLIDHDEEMVTPLVLPPIDHDEEMVTPLVLPPLAPVTERRRQRILRQDVLDRSHARAMQPPEFFCCVCCRLLYVEEVCRLKIPPSINVDDLHWP